MSKNMVKAFLGSVLALGVCGTSLAAPISCAAGGHDVSNKVAGTSACQRLAVPTDGNAPNDDEDLVNKESFFKISDWSLEGKYDDMEITGGKDDSRLFDFTGNNESGTYSYVGTGPAPASIMFIFKSGNGTNLVAYLLSQPYGTALTYASPFIPGLFGGGNTKGISHISVYTSDLITPPDNPGKVPEPATLALLGLGLGLAGLTRRQVISKSS